MKRLLILLLCLIISASLFSCKFVDGVMDKLGIGDTDGDDDNKPAPTTDEGKLNAMLEKITSSLKPTEESETSIEDILQKIDDVSFSVEDLQIDGAALDASVIFDDNTLYLRGGTDTEQLIRICKYGILTVSNNNGQVESSMLPFEDLTGTLSVIDASAVTNALTFEKGDLDRTDDDHIYKVNMSFFLRVGRALSGNEDFTLDRDAIPTVIIDMSEYDMTGKTKISIAEKESDEVISVTLSISEAENGLTVFATVTASSTTLNAEMLISEGTVKKLEISGTVNTEGEKADISLKYELNEQNNASLSADLSIGEIELTLNFTASNNADKAEADICVKSSGEKVLSLILNYDSEAFKKPGEIPVKADIEFINGEESITLSASVKTEEFKENEAKYSLILEYKSGVDIGRGTANMYFPAKSSPTVSKKSSLHLNHGTNILKNYPAYKEKAEILNNQMTEILSSGKFSMLQPNYVTYDSTTGIYYVTSISAVNGTYVSTTYSSPDAFRYGYAYRQNLGGFKNEAISKAESYARKLSPLIAEDKYLGYGQYYTYTYIEDYDVYMLMEGDDYTSLAFTFTEPSEYQQLNGASIHKLAFDENGKVKIHTYVDEVTDECTLKHVCSHCGFYKLDGKRHDYSTDISEDNEGEDESWRFTHCQRCGVYTLNVYDGDISVTFTLDEMRVYYLLDARGYDGFENFDIMTDDYAHSLVITNMKVNGKWTSETHIDIVIPDLSVYCEYRIVGIDYSRDQYNYQNLSMSLVIPEGVEFINESAFLQVKFITKVTLPATLKIICEDAFWRCGALKDVIFGNEDTYVGENAFEGTLIGDV